MVAKQKTGMKIGILPVLIVLMIGIGFLAARRPAGNIGRGDEYTLHLSMTWSIVQHVQGKMYIEVWIGGKLFFHKDYDKGPWGMSVKARYDQRVRLLGQSTGNVIEATCRIFDDNGNVHDEKSKLLAGNVETPIECVAVA